METEVANTAGWHGWHLRVAHLLVSFLCLFLLARKAVATMVPAAAKCMIDERNVNHPRRRD
jgi:hypothetical protein